MNSKKRVLAALNFEESDRIPRHLWVLPGAEYFQGENVKKIRSEFPDDITGAPEETVLLPYMRGNRYEPGIYIDDWRCEYINLQKGIIGEVKTPLVNDWSELDRVKPPYEIISQKIVSEKVNAFCKSEAEKFIVAGYTTLFERMQYIRGPENLYMDFALSENEVIALADIVHRYNLAYVEAWCRTDVDAVTIADDWGSQNALLIRPAQWQKIFKPKYKEYADAIHNAGKFVFMHSDGYIMDIYEDLIEIGIDAINSQLFCMPIEEIGEKFAGRITFWGEIDRQYLLTDRASEEEIRAGVRRLWKNLSHSSGGVIAQFEYGIDTNYKNARAAFDEWSSLS